MFRNNNRLIQRSLASLIGIFLLIAITFVAFAASTSKTLSTNFTLINFGSGTANVTASYYKEDGSNWEADPGNTNFSIDPNGGQKIVRQYFDTTLSDGRGSVVINSDEPLGGVVQILARDQTPTSGAYSGFIEISDTYYVPLLLRHLTTASGVGNSQIMIQNAGSSTTTATVEFLGPVNYTKNSISIPTGTTYFYDIEEESNLGENWYGAAIVSSDDDTNLAVVVNIFTGDHALRTYNAFPDTSYGTEWVIPLFASRLGNGLSSAISIQNVSTSTIPIDGITLSCKKDPNSPGTDFSKSNSSAIQINTSYHFNPVGDASFQEDWYGACRISSSENTVVFVQMRKLGTDEAGAFEAMNANSTDTTVFVPLVGKLLANGFATAVTIQNLNISSSAHVTFTYIPSPEYIASGGSSANIVVGPYEIPAGASIIHNHRLVGAGSGTGQHNLPDGWWGSLTVTSSDQPIHGFVQLTNVYATEGDTFMAHNVFTQ